MRKFAILFLAAASCDAMFPKDHELRGFTDEEMKAGPSYHQMKGAILNDVRIWRQLEKKLDEGRATCAAVVIGEKDATCANDKEPLETYYLTSEMGDKPYRVEETAYYCTTESLYYYHYVGGPRNLNVWMGPYRLERKRPRTDD